jgi:hypothetical protein
LEGLSQLLAYLSPYLLAEGNSVRMAAGQVVQIHVGSPPAMGLHFRAGLLEELEQRLYFLPATSHISIQQVRLGTADLSISNRHTGDDTTSGSLGRYAKNPVFRANKDKRGLCQGWVIPARQPGSEMRNRAIENRHS